MQLLKNPLRPRQWLWLASLVVLLLPLWVYACGPLIYSSPALEARVVDEATGQPLEGVIAVAHWQLRGGFHEDAVGELVVMEAMTDATGRFRFPGWGPKLCPGRSFLRPSDAPALVLFKSDYEVSYPPAERNFSMKISPSRLPLPIWHGQTLTMKKFTGSVEEYAKQLHFLEGALGFALRNDDCLWKQVPRMLVAFDQEQTRLVRARGVPKGSEAIEHWAIEGWEKSFSPARSRRCGSMKDYLRSYIP